MISTVKFKEKKKYRALGRNGSMWQNGVEIWDGIDYIILYPLNSKGETGMCSIQIPKEHLVQFIEELNKFL